MNAAQLLNPKAFAKANKSAPKKSPNYGTLFVFLIRIIASEWQLAGSRYAGRPVQFLDLACDSPGGLWNVQ
jgi:hypothetical protein